MPGNGISGGWRPLSISSSKESLKPLGHTINFDDNWLQYFEVNYDDIIESYKQKTFLNSRRYLHRFLQKS